MSNVIKRIFIGVAIALIVFFIKDKCFALDISYYRHQYQYTDYSVEPSETVTSSWTNQGTALGITNLSGHERYLNYYGWTVGATSSANGFLSGYTYQVEFTITSNYNLLNTGANFNFSSNSGNGSCSYYKTTNDNQWVVTCLISPPANTAFLSVYVRPNSNVRIGTTPYTQTLSGSKVTQLPNYDAITANTAQVISSTTSNIRDLVAGIIQGNGETKNILSSFKSNFDSAVAASTVGGSVQGPSAGNPWTNSGIAGAESGLVGSIGDFTLDTQTFQSPFEFIWSIIQSFLNIPAAAVFMSAILFVLMLGFARMVIGKS